MGCDERDVVLEAAALLARLIRRPLGGCIAMGCGDGGGGAASASAAIGLQRRVSTWRETRDARDAETAQQCSRL
jgi:hypothetical protein